MSRARGQIANVRWVHEAGLCHGCGACAAVCPVNAIQMVNHGSNNFPAINDNCTECGLCNTVCSGQFVDGKLSRSLAREAISSDEHVYLAHSNEQSVRDLGTSGGFITQYLIELLRRKVIDGAIVATSDGTISGIRSSIARTADDVLAAAGSKYYPVSSCSALRGLRDGERYAFVGKGCDVSSLRLIEEAVERFNRLIYVRIGLFCYHTPSSNASKQLLERHGFISGASTLIYRDHGWPGQTVLSDGEKRVCLEYKDSWGEHFSGMEKAPYRCAICRDGFAEQADIAVGDAWATNPTMENRLGGDSLVVAYTAKGRDEIERLRRCVSVSVERVSGTFLAASQPSLFVKQEAAIYRLLVLRLLRRITPLDRLGYWQSVSELCRFASVRGLSLRRLAGALRFAISGRRRIRQQ